MAGDQTWSFKGVQQVFMTCVPASFLLHCFCDRVLWSPAGPALNSSGPVSWLQAHTVILSLLSAVILLGLYSVCLWDKVTLAYNPCWPGTFHAEQTLILSVLPASVSWVTVTSTGVYMTSQFRHHMTDLLKTHVSVAFECFTGVQPWAKSALGTHSPTQWDPPLPLSLPHPCYVAPSTLTSPLSISVCFPVLRVSFELNHRMCDLLWWNLSLSTAVLNPWVI